MNISAVGVNKFDIVSDEAIEIVDDVINCVLLNCVAILGIIGNVLNVAVLATQGMKDTTNVILMSLSCVDLVYVVLIPIRRGRCIVAKFDALLAQTYDAILNVYLVVL